ncbi:MAG: dihydropteroate synthase [Myxococcota bacterium]|nr:dihydropteroate synthase [Myxococcota bacterium]
MAQPPWLSEGAPVVMGILNLTPDSFSDGGELTNKDQLLARAESMRSGGAQLLDLGAVSTRPGSLLVSQEEELHRLLPAVESLISEGFEHLSIDTYRPAVARAALAAGACMINDVRAAREPGMLELLGERKPWVCLMHMRGQPETMQRGELGYRDALAEIGAWLAERAQAAIAAGLPQAHLLIDPGIGFGKSDTDNLGLTLGCAELRAASGCELLYGASRKSLVGRIAGIDSPQQRLPGSLSLLGAAFRAGARVFRVHDVAETVQFLKLELALLQAKRARA